MTTLTLLALLCPGSSHLAPHVDSAARRYLVPAVVLVAMMRAESNCRADARGRHGEVGLMQLRGVARNGLSRRELLDPRTNILTGARWLALMDQDCGGTGLVCALGAYNTGKACKKRDKSKKCKAARRYARKVLRIAARERRQLDGRR